MAPYRSLKNTGDLSMSRDSIDAVMGRLSPLLDEFSAIATHGHSTYRTYPPHVLVEHTTRSAATCTYDHIVAEAERRFDGRTDIRMIPIRGLKLWLIGEDHHTVIRWKKMDEDGRSRNYPTKQAKAFDHNDELPGLPPMPTRVTVGYLLDATGTGIRRVQLAKPNGKFVEWCAAIVPTEARVPGASIWEDVTQQGRLIG